MKSKVIQKILAKTNFVVCTDSGLASPARRASPLKVTVDLRGVFWGKQYSALCINGKYINLYIIGYDTSVLKYVWFNLEKKKEFHARLS